MAEDLTCDSCNGGSMARTKVRRRHSIFVFIGFIALILSLVGVGIGVTSVAVTYYGSSLARKSTPELEAELRQASVPELIIERVLAGHSLTDEEMNAFVHTQQSALMRAQIAVAARSLISGDGKDHATADLYQANAVITTASLVVGFVGWLLLRRKWVLQCVSCRAVRLRCDRVGVATHMRRSIAATQTGTWPPPNKPLNLTKSPLRWWFIERFLTGAFAG